jgi:hypothetical protein
MLRTTTMLWPAAVSLLLFGVLLQGCPPGASWTINLPEAFVATSAEHVMDCTGGRYAVLQEKREEGRYGSPLLSKVNSEGTIEWTVDLAVETDSYQHVENLLARDTSDRLVVVSTTYYGEEPIDTRIAWVDQSGVLVQTASNLSEALGAGFYPVAATNSFLIGGYYSYAGDVSPAPTIARYNNEGEILSVTRLPIDGEITAATVTRSNRILFTGRANFIDENGQQRIRVGFLAEATTAGLLWMQATDLLTRMEVIKIALTDLDGRIRVAAYDAVGGDENTLQLFDFVGEGRFHYRRTLSTNVIQKPTDFELVPSDPRGMLLLGVNQGDPAVLASDFIDTYFPPEQIHRWPGQGKFTIAKDMVVSDDGEYVIVIGNGNEYGARCNPFMHKFPLGLIYPVITD